MITPVAEALTQKRQFQTGKGNRTNSEFGNCSITVISQIHSLHTQIRLASHDNVISFEPFSFWGKARTHCF